MPVWKIYILCNSNYMIFLKMQNYKHSKKNHWLPGLRRRRIKVEEVEHNGLLGWCYCYGGYMILYICQTPWNYTRQRMSTTVNNGLHLMIVMYQYWLIITSISHYCSDLQSFSSHGTHKLNTKNSVANQKYIFLQVWQKNRYNFDSFTSDDYCCVGRCHFLFDNIREKRWVPLTKYSGITCFKISCKTLVENCYTNGRW